jgi:hypothetical protein
VHGTRKEEYTGHGARHTVKVQGREKLSNLDSRLRGNDTFWALGGVREKKFNGTKKKA